jgi:hypothetical protein
MQQSIRFCISASRSSTRDSDAVLYERYPHLHVDHAIVRFEALFHWARRLDAIRKLRRPPW